MSCGQFTVNQNIPQRIWKILFLYFGPFNSECSNSFEITYLWLKIDFKLYVVLQVILEYKWSSCSTVTRFLGPEKTHISWNSIPASCEKNTYLNFLDPIQELHIWEVQNSSRSKFWGLTVVCYILSFPEGPKLAKYSPKCLSNTSDSINFYLWKSELLLAIQ